MCNDYHCNVCDRIDKHVHLKPLPLRRPQLFKITSEPATECEITRRALEIAVQDLGVYQYARKIKTGNINDYIDLAEKELEAE